jgi:predicted HicB family RNase H-like nuclease
MEKPKRLNIAIDAALHRRLKVAATRRGEKLRYYIERLLKENK